jgi:hypothetical protein
LEIDPNLARLQRLIETKRSQQNLAPTVESKPVGRAGNPKFAAAAARARAAMSSGQVNLSSHPGLSALKNNAIEKTNSIKESGNISLYSGNKLTQTQGSSNINMDVSTIRSAAGEKHLGQYIDKYA